MDERLGYIGVIPDIPKFEISGNTPEETFANIVMSLDSYEIGNENSFEFHSEEYFNKLKLKELGIPNDAKSHFVLTSLDTRDMSRRINVSMKESVLSRIDEYIHENHLKRSAFLERASLQFLRSIS